MTVYAYIVCDSGENMVEQIKSLAQFGYEEQIAATDGTVQKEMIFARLTQGDVLVVKEMGLFRLPVRPLFEFLVQLSAKNIDFIFLDEGVDSREERGKLFMQHFELIYHMEVQFENQRYGSNEFQHTHRMRQPGRPRITKNQVAKIMELYQDTTYSIRKIAEEVGVSVGTVHKYAKEREI